MAKTNWKLYIVSLGILLALSAYPLAMGLKIAVLQLADGSIRTEDYARYVIPYTALCLSVLTAAALYPLISKLRRFAALAATMLALGLFVGGELYMESITVRNASVPPNITSAAAPNSQGSAINGAADQTAADWQLFSCVASPQAVKAALNPDSAGDSAVGNALRQDYNDSFRIHYFLVSFVLIALVTGLVYGYGRAYSPESRADKRPLRLQLATAVILLGLCVFANFTGFFRGTEEYQPPLPSLLTGLFFVALGTAAGIYLGSRLLGRNGVFSVVLPAAASVIVCSVMYYGEYKLLGGTLYRFGTSPFFQPLPGVALAPADFLVILLAGGATGLVLGLAGNSPPRRPSPSGGCR